MFQSDEMMVATSTTPSNWPSVKKSCIWDDPSPIDDVDMDHRDYPMSAPMMIPVDHRCDTNPSQSNLSFTFNHMPATSASAIMTSHSYSHSYSRCATTRARIRQNEMSIWAPIDEPMYSSQGNLAHGSGDECSIGSRSASPGICLTRRFDHRPPPVAAELNYRNPKCASCNHAKMKDYAVLGWRGTIGDC